VEMADKKWKIQLKAPELAGRVEGKTSPIATPVPQATVARALPASAAISIASDPLSILKEMQDLAREAGFTDEEIALRIREVRVGDRPYCFVSGKHYDPRTKQLENTLARQAIQKELVCLDEGLFRNRYAEQLHAKSKFLATDSGYLYGLENEANHAFYTAWVMLEGLIAPSGLYFSHQRAFLHAFLVNPTVRKYVQELASSGCASAKELQMRLGSASAELGLDDFHASISEFKDSNKWHNFVCQLTDIALVRGRSESMRSVVKDVIQDAAQYNSSRMASAIELISGRVSLQDALTRRLDQRKPLMERLLAESRPCRDPEYAALLVQMSRALPKKGAVVLLGFNHFEGVIENLRKLEATTKTEEKKKA
jgi:hypothetical protein